MSILSALFDRQVYNFEQAFGVKDVTSNAINAAVRDWYSLYYSDRATEREDPCQRIPVAVVSKLTRTAFSEYSVRAEKENNTFLQSILAALDLVRKKALQQALIGGTCILKPILSAGGVQFVVVSRNDMCVLARNVCGEITDIGMAEQTMLDGKYYTLMERRTVDTAGYLTIQNRLFCSNTEHVPGLEVSLNLLPQYATLQPVNRLPEPVGSLGLIHVRTPLENCVDGSWDAVSIYAPAVGLIHNINTNEAQINGEFERGESRIIVSGDMLDKREPLGKKQLLDHVFTGLDDNPENVGLTIFSPAFREQSFLARKTEYLRNVESLIGLKRGILSEIEAAERTATEITSSAGDYNLTIIDVQQMWEVAVREAVRVCDVLGRMYALTGGATMDLSRDIVIDWGNGILYDQEKEWADYTQMTAAGMLKPEIALAWKFNLPWETPEDLAKIRAKYMPEMEGLTSDDMPPQSSGQVSTNHGAVGVE